MIFRGLNCYGPITRFVQDAALMLDAMKGRHPHDRESLVDDGTSYFKAVSMEDRPAGLKIAYLPTLGYVPLVEPEIAEMVATAAQRFKELGWTVEEPPFKTKNPEEPYVSYLMASAAHFYRNKMGTSRHLISPNLVKMIDVGMTINGITLLDAIYRRITLYEEFARLFKTYDLLLSPAMPCTAFPHGFMFPQIIAGKKTTPLGFISFTYPVNMTGLPAAAVPIGLSKEGLPVSLQIIGPLLGDLAVLQASRAFEQIAPWHSRKPPMG
ncbi:MAG: Asp-tRNAAsn/Glu-tRNAGln amidotransferase A subunit [Promethearchaeota archaeon CR_4]|nr:MAG: Asp-tRNAAsn/Glu-tRNAGln amidotransferase A subunit [Candidatus Lokiarchaeota archaeon CR_4]